LARLKRSYDGRRHAGIEQDGRITTVDESEGIVVLCRRYRGQHDEPRLGRLYAAGSVREWEWPLLAQSGRSHNAGFGTSAFEGIRLQKSKVASVRIFGETLKREAIDDSDNLSRDPSVSLPSVADIAAEFLLNVSRTHRLPLKAGHVINLSRSAGPS
jgi:hypothetical protein